VVVQQREFIMGWKNQQCDYDPRDGIYGRAAERFHGGNIRIYESAIGIKHENRLSGKQSLPTIRSYADGVKVGCSFLTTDALQKIYSWHQDFLRDHKDRTWQFGTEIE
jgi:hypothetical protein